jgi:hypothetical protein
LNRRSCSRKPNNNAAGRHHEKDEHFNEHFI